MSYIEDRIANCERYIHDLQDGLREMEEKHNALLDGVGEIYNRLRPMEKDAEPVRHGKWIFIERREPQYDILGVKTWGVAYRCSECGFVHSVIEDFGHYTFCPRCGAKIDEVEE